MRAGYQIGDNCNSDVGGEPDALKGASPVRRGAEGRSQRDATRPTLRLPSYFYARPAPPTPTLLSARQDRIDAFFAAIPSKIRRGGDRAFFSYTFDYIQMPHAGSFKSADAHASILAHEHAHWTGHSSRLDRTFGKKFGDKAYCVEELVAELTGAMVCSDLGLPSEIHDSHANYVADWLRVLRADKSAIFVAATKAEQAFAYLRAFSDEAAARDAEKLAA